MCNAFKKNTSHLPSLCCNSAVCSSVMAVATLSALMLRSECSFVPSASVMMLMAVFAVV
jgi:hypothetical protein